MLKTFVSLHLILLILLGLVFSLEATKKCMELQTYYSNQLIEDHGVCEKILDASVHIPDELNLLKPLEPTQTCKCNLIAKDIWSFLKNQESQNPSDLPKRISSLKEFELHILEEEQKERESELKMNNLEQVKADAESDDEEDDVNVEDVEDTFNLTPVEEIYEENQVAFDRAPTEPIVMDAIQHGVCKSIIRLPRVSYGEVFPTYKEFSFEESISFPKIEMGHDFNFVSKAPVAYQKIRGKLEINNRNYITSMCNYPWIEISNPGKSGNGMFMSGDRKYIIKTLKPKESFMLQKMLPKYFMNLCNNEKSLISIFLGQYVYSRYLNEFSFVVMNNLMPTNLNIHSKYDLKGSTYGRFADDYERSKKSPTFKDLDFLEHHPGGIILRPDVFDSLMRSIDIDLDFLESSRITDFTLLLGIYYLDSSDNDEQVTLDSLKRISHWSAVPATTKRGERLLLFIGIIDILQKYNMKKRIEHTYKSITYGSTSISIQDSSFYCMRFKDFMSNTVFKRG